eukprot:gnl/TRDRNA2_/TRDRNA2_174694_c0_seq3.p1 gnl/TRDRNA2_/TRDRNA2_174694_c0~~gnl/TRDRNA2_/TRDRNA2_174694_c0_seq3.p1  ORF type:complete len:210 (+),score=43.34 gnl/TRDRNA2_/TRDRNA2_174694_c0_seq3:122-751(+)
MKVAPKTVFSQKNQLARQRSWGAPKMGPQPEAKIRKLRTVLKLGVASPSGPLKASATASATANATRNAPEIKLDVEPPSVPLNATALAAVPNAPETKIDVEPPPVPLKASAKAAVPEIIVAQADGGKVFEDAHTLPAIVQDLSRQLQPLEDVFAKMQAMMKRHLDQLEQQETFHEKILQALQKQVVHTERHVSALERSLKTPTGKVTGL